MANIETKENEEKKDTKGSFTIADLDSQEKKNDYLFVTSRIQQLMGSRKNHYGHDLDKIWAEADRDYIPHRLRSKSGRKAYVEDEEKGWRSSMVNLGDAQWQVDVSQANPFIKIQTALSILVDQNPGAVFTPASQKYQDTNAILEQLYERSWEYAKSKNQLKLFIFNLAKYGWACARTYPLKITRKVKVLREYDEDNPDQSEYETKEIVEYNDIMRENLDPRNVWIDEMARPGDSRTVNDWCYRKVYDFDLATEEFGKYEWWDKFVQAGGNTQETVEITKEGNVKQPQNADRKKIEIYFYENKPKDLMMVLAGGVSGVPVIIEPLPIADEKGIKRLSLWQTLWNLRHGESPYGIGIYEAIRYDQSVLDRIRNMTIDQLTLSIYKMFFYQGTQSLSETGDVRITPGVGKQVLDPKNIKWLEVPGPGQDAYLGIDMFRKDVDEASGITDPLLGQVTGKTAFEIAQAKESALKRLKNPLDNILEALNEEAYTTIALMQLLYSIPEVIEIADDRMIEDYLREIKADPELFERTEDELDENGEVVRPGVFQAKVFREFPLNLDKDEKGNLIETNDTKFFRAKPGALSWAGVIQVKAQSLLAPSKQVDKALDLEMYNLLIPLLQGIQAQWDMKLQTGQPPVLDDIVGGKVAKSIVRLYDKDPRDVLPDSWLQEQTPEQTQQQSTNALQQLFVQARGGQNPQMPQGAPQAQTVGPSPTAPQNPRSLAGKIMSRISAPFRST